MRSARAVYTESFIRGMKLDPILSVSDWADQNRILSSVASKESGRYRTIRTPYLREIMDALSVHNPCTEIILMKPTQIGGSEVANNFIGYIIDCAPGPILYMLPTVELVEDHSKNRITPMIDNTPSLLEKVQIKKSKTSGNTVLSKKFLGGALYMAGSNSGASYRNKSIRYLILDDIDGFVADVEGEGNPINLAEKRTDTYSSRKKIFKISTPTNKGASLIEFEFLNTDQRYYHVPCPFCGFEQVLVWGNKNEQGGIKFQVENHILKDVWYECKSCSARIEEYHKTQMLEQGKWVPKFPNRAKRGYHISGLMSPIGFVSWFQIVTEFLDARKSTLSLKVWVNTRKGETFESAGDQPEWTLLSGRCEPYKPMTVPIQGQFITGGVDVQDNRIAVVLRAWGMGEESWLIFHGEFYEDAFAQLDQLLATRIYSVDNRIVPIVSVGVDSGFRTQEVYNYCRFRGPTVFALKGERSRHKAIVGKPTLQDVSWRGKTIEKGIKLWHIGVDTAKATLYSRFKEKVSPGPGCYHWYIGTSEEYFLQVTGEKQEVTMKDGFPILDWVKVRERNEALDCEVYAYAAAIRAGLTWMRMESTDASPSEQPKQPINFTTPIMPTPPPKRPTVAVRSSFMSR